MIYEYLPKSSDTFKFVYMAPKNYQQVQEDSFQQAKIQDFNSKQYESYQSIKQNGGDNNDLEDQEIKKEVIQFPSNDQIIQLILEKLPEYSENIASMTQDDLRELYVVAVNAPQNNHVQQNASQDLNQSKTVTQPIIQDHNWMKGKIVQIFPDMKNQLQSFNSQEIRQIYESSFGNQNGQQNNKNSNKNINKSVKEVGKYPNQIGSLNDDQIQAIYNESMTRNSGGAVKKLPVSKGYNSKKIDLKSSVQVPHDYLNKKKNRSDFSESRSISGNKFRSQSPQVHHFSNNMKVRKTGLEPIPNSARTVIIFHTQYPTGQSRKLQKADKKSNCRCKCCLRRESQPMDSNSFTGFMRSLFQKYGS